MSAFPDDVLRGWFEELAETGEVKGHGTFRNEATGRLISHSQLAIEWAMGRIEELERNAH